MTSTDATTGPKVPSRTVNVMAGHYTPPRAAYVRNDGNKHIKSLSTVTQQPAPAVVIEAPHTSIAPKNTMATPKVQIPAKPTGKRTPKDEDYATTYQPPAPVPAVKQSLTTEEPAPVVVADRLAALAGTDPDLNNIPIEDGIPMPPTRVGVGMISGVTALLTRMNPSQSVLLPIKYQHCARKAVDLTNKTGLVRYVLKLRSASGDLRIWRIK